MITVEYDLRYLEAALIDLEGYLLSNEIYWPTGVAAPAGSPAFPRLTLGGILLSQARLQARQLTDQEKNELTRLESKLDETRKRWRAAWGRKATQGFHTRLNLWNLYLNEYRQDPDANDDRYAYEVRRRVMLDLLKPTADQLPQVEIELLEGLDKLLRSVFIQGNFIWEPEIQSGFPPPTYWYLYGHLRG